MKLPTLSEQIERKCVHYNGLSGPWMSDDFKRCCRAGVQYRTVTDTTKEGGVRYPCFKEDAIVPCEKRHFPTPEEIAAEIAESEASWERLKLGISAASEDAKKKGLKEGNGGVGSVPCPVCKTGTLHYSVAGCNGHMHGRCTTPTCLNWMQ